MKIKKIFPTLVLINLFFHFIASAYSSENLFYVTPRYSNIFFSDSQIQNIKKHAAAINIIAPQIYAMDEDGLISGKIDPALLAIAKLKHIKIMPLIINNDFDQQSFSNFLNNSSAQKRAIEKLILLGEKYHFYGWQFDYENIHINDKDKLTRFFQLAAQNLHKKGLKISIAVLPSSNVFYDNYDRWYYENWSGAYDYAPLSQSADFISVMAYDRHTTLTTPGPVAPKDWVEIGIKCLLKIVPANKISLGLPTYSGYWMTGALSPGKVDEKFIYRSKEKQISYQEALTILKNSDQLLVWQPAWQSFYVILSPHNKNEYLFIENAKSFNEKLKLVSKYHLRGISVWKLELEDPNIWNSFR